MTTLSSGRVECRREFDDRVGYGTAIDTSSHTCPAGQSVAAEWTRTPGTGTYYVAPICVDSQGKKVEGSTPVAGNRCESLIDWFGITCFGRLVSTVIGTALVTATAWLLATAGYLFNLLIDHTVVKFGETLLRTEVRQAIEVGWTALRDLANIVIISMFVFIAINIILGVKEFGEKKLIARVLIVAVLINFSLLFSKAIIDASNFTALQFVRASGFQSESRNLQGAFDTEFVKTGIAGEFIKVMGIATMAETYQALSRAAFGDESNKFTNANGWYALLHGLVSATLLLIAAGVFLYASFLLIARAVLLIFLMMTSALAFASWLIPQQFIGKGFSTWWQSLIKAATFAPILMIFLWASLKVAQALPQSGTLGAMVADPSQTLNLEALFNYVIVIGLLIVSVISANAFARSIAGFRFATAFSALPLTAGSRFLVAPALRQTAGWLGYRYERSRLKQAREARDEAGAARQEEAGFRRAGYTKAADEAAAKARRLEGFADTKLRRAARGSAIAESRMNIMDTGVMKSAARAAGADFTGESVKATKSYADQIKARTEAAEKEAAKIAPSADQNEKAKQEVREKREAGLKDLQVRRDAERANAETVKRFEQLGEKLIATQQHAQNEEGSASRNKVVIEERFRASAGSPADIARRSAEMKIEDQRIARARQAVQLIQQRIDVLERPVKEAEKAVGEYEEQTEQIGKEIVAAMGESAANIAERVGRRSGDVLTRAIGKLTGANEIVAQNTRDLYKKRVRTANLRDVVASVQAETAPSPPPPPQAPPPPRTP
ncbi:hypothetical protein HYW60_01795 [Candidatus Kaiserbacteria bacterium]|nr:hypothetical protein [Candidatus Kaiserbacteria bacterium]